MQAIIEIVIFPISSSFWELFNTDLNTVKERNNFSWNVPVSQHIRLHEKIMAMFKSRLCPNSFHRISQLVIFENCDFKFHSKTLEFQSHLHLPSTLPTGMLFYMKFIDKSSKECDHCGCQIQSTFKSNYLLIFLVFPCFFFFDLFYLSPWDKPLSAKVYYH